MRVLTQNDFVFSPNTKFSHLFMQLLKACLWANLLHLSIASKNTQQKKVNFVNKISYMGSKKETVYKASNIFIDPKQTIPHNESRTSVQVSLISYARNSFFDRLYKGKNKGLNKRVFTKLV